MKQVCLLTLCLMACSVVRAQEPTKSTGVSREATEVLQKSAAALGKVRIATYTADYKGTKWVATRVPAVTGVATIGKRSRFDVDPFFVDVKLTADGDEKPRHYQAGSNGDVYFLIDSDTKTVYEDMDPLVLGEQSRNIQRVLMREFADPKPYKDAMEAGTVQLLETSIIGGEPCHVVSVEGEQPPVMRYYIATKDYLPRKIVRTYKNPDGEEGTTELAIRDLNVNPSFTRSPFETMVPAGYSKTDEFAP